MRVSGVVIFVALSAPILAAQQPSATPPALTVRGVVTTANDAPLARVRVAVSGAPGSELPVLTDERGQFTVRALATDSVRLTFTRARYATVIADVRRTELSGSPARELRVRMSLGGSISGVVRDRSGAPVMLASVLAGRLGPAFDPANPLLTVTTNDLGEFRFGGLEAGAYQIAARPPTPFSTATLQDPDAPPGSADQPVTVSLGADVSGVDVTFDLPSELRRSGAPRPVDPTATGSLRGRVLTPQGTPIAGAVVQAYLNGAPSEAVETDARGRYAITRLAAGQYTVQAFKHGFLTPQPGRGSSAVEILLRDRNSSDEDRLIAVGANQSVDSVDVTLARGGAIAGTIVDEFGEPMQGVMVTVLELRALGGRTRALRAATANNGNLDRTDDRGRYRLFGLQPGTYFVQAVTRDLLTETNGYAPRFYPGAETVDIATATKLDLGAIVTGIDFTLAPAAVRRVRGTVTDPSGEPANLNLTMMVSERSRAIQTEPVSTRVAADGSFAFNNVAPGDYVVQATGTASVRGSSAVAVGRQFAASFVTVSGDDPPPVTLSLTQGATLMGRFVYEGIASPPRSGVSLTAIPADFDRGPVIGGGATGFAVLPDQTFEYRGVFGPSFLVARPGGPDWYVKSITLQGQDLSDSPFDFGYTDTFRDIEVVISGAGAAVAGRVTDERAMPVRNYTVALFPVDRAKWTIRSRWLKNARSMQDGAFRVTGLVPGDYWVVAVDRLAGNDVAGDLQDPQVLDGLTSRAVRISLGEGQTQDMTLRLVRR